MIHLDIDVENQINKLHIQFTPHTKIKWIADLHVYDTQ